VKLRAILVAAPLMALAAACHKSEADDAAGEHAVSVGTAVATARDVPQAITAIGTVTPRPGRFADLSAPAATRVAQVFVAPGQRVAQGTALVEFERAPFEAASRGADLAVAAAQANFDRAQRLSQVGVLPRKDVDQAASDLAQAQTAAVTAHRSLELATLRAPIAGVVTRMTAALGQPVDASQELVEVVDPDALDVVFALSPDVAALVHPGATISTSAGADARGASLGDGTVTSVGAAVDSVSRAVPIRAQISRPARALRVGETVSGRIVVGIRRHAVTIPPEALIPEGDSFRVFVVDSAGLARQRMVQVGVRADSLVEILAGVAAGETVVTRGAYGLEDSVKVARPKP
jgi:RND family efflux transporter MFP subunit